MNKTAKEVIHGIAVAGNEKLKNPISPCGKCRQAMSEAERQQESEIQIAMISYDKKVKIVLGVKSLLPFPFDDEGL
jgi:cytidine deaminase